MGENLENRANELDCLNVFSEAEKRVILDDPSLNMEDYPFLSRVQQMSPEELASYDLLEPSSLFDGIHYKNLRLKWIEREGFFLKERKNNDGKRLTDNEYNAQLADEILRSKHSERFRAFYALRYPEKVASHKHVEIPDEYLSHVAA